MMNCGQHPSFLVYGDKTAAAAFDLILFVGREPQVDEDLVPGIGLYDFIEHPNCAFWNMAYRSVARVDGRSGFNTAALKRECMERQASPIAFADALPLCLSDMNSARTKLEARRKVTEERIEEHIDGILKLDIMQRVRLVVLSGHRVAGLEKACAIIPDRLNASRKAFVPTPFLYPTNSKAIDADLDLPSTRERIGSILRHFRAAA